MRIGILSDTHGLLRDEVVKALDGVDHIIHAGDIDRKEVIDALVSIAPVTVVRGNADKDWAEDIARSCNISPALADDICRMYLTHPGIDVAGILQRIEGR